jgi:predicted Ser/Thr protein kinase
MSANKSKKKAANVKIQIKKKTSRLKKKSIKKISGKKIAAKSSISKPNSAKKFLLKTKKIKSSNQNAFKKISLLSKGWSSLIWLTNFKGKKCVIKEAKTNSPRPDLVEREGKMLALANSVGVGPKLLKLLPKKNSVVMEFVNGSRLISWIESKEFEKVSMEQLKDFLEKLFTQAKALNSVNLSHNQLQVGKNIFVVKSIEGKKIVFSPVIIDFEKASLKPTGTKNIGQLESFLFYNPNGFAATKVRQKIGNAFKEFNQKRFLKIENEFKQNEKKIKEKINKIN